MSVPPAVAGGSTVEFKIHQQYRMLIVDPPATAGGTDIDPPRFLTFETQFSTRTGGDAVVLVVLSMRALRVEEKEERDDERFSL